MNIVYNNLSSGRGTCIKNNAEIRVSQTGFMPAYLQATVTLSPFSNIYSLIIADHIMFLL